MASGSTTVFPYPFKIVESTDLKVSVNGVVQTSGYTVSGVGNGLGGDVTFSVAPAMGATVLLELDPILSRDTDYQQYGPFPAGIVNADFDRMWKALQKFANDFKRSLKLPTDTGTDQVVNYTAGERANALLSFDAAGNLTITPITSIAVSVSAGSFTVDTFSGDGVTTAFTLSRDPGIKNNTSVFVGGVYVQKSAYSIAGTTLTFTVAPALGTANVEVTQSVALTAGAPADGTVTVASLADAALAATTQGLAKMADGFLAATTAARAKMADKFVTLAKMADMGTGKLLGNVSGVTGAPGEVSEASQAEAESGTVQTRWMSPLRVAQAIAKLTNFGSTFGSVRVAYNNAYGSTNTAIRRFVNTHLNRGTDITYADSATLGASFTINADGIYSVSYTDSFSASADFGISLNSTQLTTSISGITEADCVVMATTASGSYRTNCSATLFLSAGDVIRPHAGAAGTGSTPANSSFTISRVA